MFVILIDNGTSSMITTILNYTDSYVLTMTNQYSVVVRLEISPGFNMNQIVGSPRPRCVCRIVEQSCDYCPPSGANNIYLGPKALQSSVKTKGRGQWNALVSCISQFNFCFVVARLVDLS